MYKIIVESLRQVMSSLKGNALRTFLSILGITIGIFCIISVKSAVDSLQENIVDGFKELGSDVVYVDRIPWVNTSRELYLQYLKRPNVTYKESQEILKRSRLADDVTFAGVTGGKTLKHRSNSLSGATVFGTTYGYAEIFNMDIQQGRYFTRQEYHSGSDVIILGHGFASSLFNNINPIGREIKLNGRGYRVIGVLKEEGDNMFNFLNYDEIAWITYPNLKKIANTSKDSSIGRILGVKAKDGVSADRLKDELTGIMRSIRRIKPKDKTNFALNELSMLNQALQSVFGVLNIAGFVIGIFSLIVGMFSVANIMFVSVKERTNIIGIKKALGAKNINILVEFLIESVILCLIGGLAGLVLVFLIVQAVSSMSSFSMSLSIFNVVFGVGISIIVGVVSGIIPAYQASTMNPVDAIRG